MSFIAPFRALPRTVVILGFVSLLNDSASEMITPLLPIFLTAVLGSGPMIVGLVEGIAESTASILKLVSGRLADRGVDAKGLVFTGYAASNVARPLIGAAFGWAMVLGLRFLDRVGKGIRTAPRDALIAGATEAGRRGAAFGFHRSMDHAGAFIGPLLAYVLLASHVSLAQVFFWSAVPGFLVLLLLAAGISRSAPLATTARSAFHWKMLDPSVRAIVFAAGLLAFSSVPEVFVVLWAKDAGLDIAFVPLLWAIASLIKMTVAMPFGILSDRIGKYPVWLFALCVRVGALVALALIHAKGGLVWILFLAYSASLAMSEPSERSIVGDHAPSAQRGTAYGVYHLACGLLVLPGAFLFGAVWQYFSSSAAFIAAAVVTTVAALPMAVLARRQP